MAWAALLGLALLGVAVAAAARWPGSGGGRNGAPGEPRGEVPGQELREIFEAPRDERIVRELGRGAPGGRAIAHGPGARALPRAAAASMPRAEQLSTGRTAGEPSMGITSDGTLFYVGLTAALKTRDVVPHSVVLRSRDHGASWQQLDLLVKGVAADTVTADPYLYVDPATDRVFNADFVGPCSVISSSGDLGATFRSSALCQHTDHQTLFAGPAPPGGQQPHVYPNVVYYCAIDGGASVVSTFTGCSRSLDGGSSWRRTRSAPYNTDLRRSGGSLGIKGACGGATGHGRVDSDGVVYLPRGLCGQPYLAISRDEGDRWTRTQVSDLGMPAGTSGGLGLEQHEARVAIDRDGAVYYLWIARDRLPYLAVSRDGGRSFARPVTVAAPGVDEAWGPSLDVGDPGRIALSYMGTTNSPGPPYCVHTTLTSCRTAAGQGPKPDKAYANTTWNGYMTVSTTALDPEPAFLTTTVNDPSDPLTRGTCGVVACQQQVDFLTLVIGRDGTPWASFVDGCSANPGEACQQPGIGIVGHVVGGPPLVGPLGDTAAKRQRCTPRRRFAVRVAKPRRGRLRRVRVYADGRRVRAVLRRGAARAVVDPRKARRRSFTVRIVARTSTGRTFTMIKRYRLCPRRGSRPR